MPFIEALPVPKSITDNAGRVYEVIITQADFDGFDLYLFDQKTYVGWVKCAVEARDYLILSDIVVLNEVIDRRNWLSRLLDRLLRKPVPLTNYQQRGLGTQLLQLALTCARHKKVKTLSGWVRKKDVVQNPGLLRWYEKHGFEVIPVAGEEITELQDTTKVADIVLTLAKG